MRVAQYTRAMNVLRAVDPKNPELVTLTAPGYVPSTDDIRRVEAAAKTASIKRVRDYVMPDGVPIGQSGDRAAIRIIPGGGYSEARKAFDYMSQGGTPLPFEKGELVRLPGNAGYLTFRPLTSTPKSPAIDINVPGIPYKKLHY